MYRIECDCGHAVLMEELEGVCPDCGVMVRIVWPGAKKPGALEYEREKSDGDDKQI